VIETQLEFVDIAGLVRGASTGEGLGNQFLGNIREVDAIVHVLRCFEGGDVTHVENRVDPVADAEIVETELMLSDLESLEKRVPNLGKKAAQGDKEAKVQASVLGQALELLRDSKPARLTEPKDAEEKVALERAQLLTAKPVLYVCNVDEGDAAEGNAHSARVFERAAAEGARAVIVSAAIEAEIVTMAPEDRGEFLSDLGLTETGLARVIRAGYDLLHLITFFTAGPKEARAWTVEQKSKAPQAAGVIHTDFERGFIRAETIGYADFVACGGEAGAKEAGKMRSKARNMSSRTATSCCSASTCDRRVAPCTKRDVQQSEFCPAILPLLHRPGCGQAEEGDRPVDQPWGGDAGLCADGGKPGLEPARMGCGRGVRVAKDVDVIEAGLTDQALRIDRQPAATAEVEHISVMDVAVQGHDVALVVEQAPGCPRGQCDGAARTRRRRIKGPEPVVELDHVRVKWGRAPMQPPSRSAEDTRRLRVVACAGECLQRRFRVGPRQQQGVFRLRENRRGPLTRPPRHQPVAPNLLLMPGQLEHGGGGAAAHRQQRRVVRTDQGPIDGEPPARQIGFERILARITRQPGRHARHSRLRTSSRPWALGITGTISSKVTPQPSQLFVQSWIKAVSSPSINRKQRARFVSTPLPNVAHAARSWRPSQRVNRSVPYHYRRSVPPP
jgi:GTP-binding protein YchF